MDEVCTQAQAHACPAARRLRGVVRLAAHEATRMGVLMRSRIALNWTLFLDFLTLHF